MGLQYFEALSPATVSSIVAVLTNRLVVGNDVTGYYSYPFLTTTLPSGIFTSAIVYGFFGAAVGVAYAVGCKKFKTLAHDLFPSPAIPTTNSGDDDTPRRMNGEQKPLLEGQDSKKGTRHVPDSPGVLLRLWKAVRIAFAGCVIGAIVGGIGMFIPHSMFWGEAQLQTLIDKGRTPLPVFGIAGEATVDLVALGRCMIDGRDAAAVRAGFGIECSFAISVAKIITTGLSLGTGIVGGQFWGPLFVGCSSGHFLTEAVSLFSKTTGYGGSLSRYPCLVILCVMGSAHVVTYRAHMAIVSTLDGKCIGL
jgi:H+/Cl- antiporter ClcA